jgi:hypothetical protein
VNPGAAPQRVTGPGRLRLQLRSRNLSYSATSRRAFSSSGPGFKRTARVLPPSTVRVRSHCSPCPPMTWCPHARSGLPHFLRTSFSDPWRRSLAGLRLPRPSNQSCSPATPREGITLSDGASKRGRTPPAVLLGYRDVFRLRSARPYQVNLHGSGRVGGPGLAPLPFCHCCASRRRAAWASLVRPSPRA